MGDTETDVDITEGDSDAVDEGNSSVTDQSQSVSTQDQGNTRKDSSAASTGTEKKSDPEARIRSLMSQLDKANAKANEFQRKFDQAVLDRAQVQQGFDAYKKEKEGTLSSAADATKAALDRSQELEKENASLLERVTRAEFFLKKPHLITWADLAPVTADAKVLEQWAERLGVATETYVKGLQDQLQGRKAAVPAAQPQRVSLSSDHRDVEKFLDEAAAKGPKAFEEAVKIVTGQART